MPREIKARAKPTAIIVIVMSVRLWFFQRLRQASFGRITGVPYLRITSTGFSRAALTAG